MTGGGSGGHITPILAVAHEIKQTDPTAEIVYIGQRGDRFAEVVADDPVIDAAYTISAGKFRRYHGEGLRQLLDFHTMWLNLRDAVRVVRGLFQSWRLLGKIRPDAVFCKGGFVGVPVGLTAAGRHIPYVTHDSDAIPGLANRIISRWASCHAVALDPELYPYPKSRTVDVGVPVAAGYAPITPAEQGRLKQQLGIAKQDKVLLVTGGGLGAVRLNRAIVEIASRLLDDFPDLHIIHTVGAAHEAVMNEAYDAALSAEARDRVRAIGYTTELAKHSGAADVVVARGGATNFAELATQAKACIIVPNPFLTGGHQLKNAAAYAAKGAVVMVDEADLATGAGRLYEAVRTLLASPKDRQDLQERIATFARPDAARELAEILVEIAKKQKGRR